MSSSPAAPRPRRPPARYLLALLLLSTAPVGGQSELVLVDGRVLSGSDVRREGDNYVLTLDSGDEITLPVQLVESVRLTGEPSAEEEYLQRNPGLRRSEPQTLGATPPPGPSGIRDDGPRQLAGEPTGSPRPSEQLEVFGEPARFQQGIGDNRWTPTTDWDLDPQAQNNWAPSKWSESIVDNSWRPESAFDPGGDVLEGSRSTWQKGPIDSSWKPTDGFRR